MSQAAPSAPAANGRPPASMSKPQSISSTRQQPSQKYTGTNGVPTTRPPQNEVSQQSKIPAATAPKPLNVQTKQPTGGNTQTDAVKKAEQALTRKDDGGGGGGGGRKEVRMSSMSESEVMGLLDYLGNEQREVLALRIVAGLTVEQVAGIVGKTAGAVKQLQRRALLTLREHSAVKEYVS